MDLIEHIVKDATSKSTDGRIGQSDFMDAAARTTRYGVFTPLETAIIFTFAGLGDDRTRLAQRDFAQLFDPKWNKDVAFNEIQPKESIATSIFKSVYNFGLGGIAGAIGATAVYPIDLCEILSNLPFTRTGAHLVIWRSRVKTRMQNQRNKVVGEVLYRNSLDCVRKVYKNEGLVGFYRGLPPQLVVRPFFYVSPRT
jgi:solute carrier family 25 aspartate/glutamate transporter 12/13